MGLGCAWVWHDRMTMFESEPPRNILVDTQIDFDKNMMILYMAKVLDYDSDIGKRVILSKQMYFMDDGLVGRIEQCATILFNDSPMHLYDVWEKYVKEVDIERSINTKIYCDYCFTVRYPEQLNDIPEGYRCVPVYVSNNRVEEEMMGDLVYGAVYKFDSESNEWRILKELEPRGGDL